MPLLQPSIEILKGFGSFTRVITQGKKFESKPLVAFVYSSISKQSKIRVGFAVARGIQKSTQRNLLKRLMREAFRIKKDSFYGLMGSEKLIEIVFLYNGNLHISTKKGGLTLISNAISTLSSTISTDYSR